jgi:Spy/CpxP family protein refolding chaperone
MKRSALLSILATVLACVIVLSATPAAAQSNGGQMPFTDIYRRPSVSPYTMMQNQAFNPLGVQNIYQEQVLPQLQIQRQQLEQIRQNQQIGTIQRDVRRLQRPPQQTSDTIRPTGHVSTFLDLSHFYPGASR